MIEVKISARSMRQEFNGCEPDYIRDVCHGACCRSTTTSSGVRIKVRPIEVIQLGRRGAVVLDGEIQPRPGERRCPFQAPGSNLCELHGGPDKPFGCIASPFVLTSRNTLIIRNRYRLLKCFQDGRRLPAYVAFRASLDLLFGPARSAVICGRLDAGEDDFTAPMDELIGRALAELDAGPAVA